MQAQITVPGSKSITNRALILAALGEGESVLSGALWSEDTQVMFDALGQLGFEGRVEQDPNEFSNRTIYIKGLGGKIPKAGSSKQPLDIFVGNAGTAARFLAPLVCLGQGSYRLHGVPRMHERPQSALFAALRNLGYQVDSPNDKLPAIIHGTGPKRSHCRVSIEESSQFASGLLLSSRRGEWEIQITGENAEESPYVAMTTALMRAFAKSDGKFQIEADASSGSYFLAANLLVEAPEYMEYSEQFGTEVRTSLRFPISVQHWPTSGWQIDQEFPRLFVQKNSLGIGFDKSRKEVKVMQELGMKLKLPEQNDFTISRAKDLGDSIMTGIVLAPLGTTKITFTELGRLRVQECERVVALRTELQKCGAKVVERNDTLEISPSTLHGAEIETYDDHRMAMCFAILGLKVPGIRIRNPACVKKTFPNFFQKLATPPPQGLGVTILDCATKRKLSLDQLFAG